MQYPSFLSDLKETWRFSTYFPNILKYQISWKSVHWEPNCSMRNDGPTDGQTWRNLSSFFFFFKILRMRLKADAIREILTLSPLSASPLAEVSAWSWTRHWQHTLSLAGRVVLRQEWGWTHYPVSTFSGVNSLYPRESIQDPMARGVSNVVGSCPSPLPVPSHLFMSELLFGAALHPPRRPILGQNSFLRSIPSVTYQFLIQVFKWIFSG